MKKKDIVKKINSFIFSMALNLVYFFVSLKFLTLVINLLKIPDSEFTLKVASTFIVLHLIAFAVTLYFLKEIVTTFIKYVDEMTKKDG